MRFTMTSILGVILVLVSVPSTVVAGSFKDESIGISIQVEDTLSKQPRRRDIQYFNSKDRSASLMIKQIHDLSITDFLAELRSRGYHNRRDGIFLGVTGKPLEAAIESGRGLMMPVSGLIRGQRIRGVIGAYSGQDGQGFLVIGSAKPEHSGAWKSRMEAMFNSVRFIEINREAMVKDWEKRVMGKQLQHKYANTVAVAHKEYHLCSDGVVVRRSGVVGLMPGQTIPGYGIGTDKPRGMWRISVLEGAPYLVVQDGREQELMLEDEGENFLLNGKPYLITASKLCK